MTPHRIALLDGVAPEAVLTAESQADGEVSCSDDTFRVAGSDTQPGVVFLYDGRSWKKSLLPRFAPEAASCVDHSCMLASQNSLDCGELRSGAGG